MKIPNKKIIIGSSIALAVIITLVAVSSGSPKSESNTGNQNQSLMSVASRSADKIEVVHFHATQQCWSCTTVGEFALKTIKEKFPEEYQNGTIVFKDTNGELPENKAIVAKYQAGGSALFVNAIIANKDNIEEDVTVWRLVSNEQQFLNYFEAKLNKLLGKS